MHVSSPQYPTHVPPMLPWISSPQWCLNSASHQDSHYEFSPAPYFFLSLRPKYLPQHPNVKPHKAMFFPLTRETTFPKHTPQFGAPCNISYHVSLLQWWIFIPFAQPLSSRITPCQLSATPYLIYSQLPHVIGERLLNPHLAAMSGGLILTIFLQINFFFSVSQGK